MVFSNDGVAGSMEQDLASSAKVVGLEISKVPPLQSVEKTTPVHAAIHQRIDL